MKNKIRKIIDCKRFLLFSKLFFFNYYLKKLKNIKYSHLIKLKIIICFIRHFYVSYNNSMRS